MSENPIVEWQSDGQKHRAVILRSFQFTNAKYLFGRMLDVPEELFIFATEVNGIQTFLAMNLLVLQCVLGGLSDIMVISAVEKVEHENKPWGLPA